MLGLLTGEYDHIIELAHKIVSDIIYDHPDGIDFRPGEVTGISFVSDCNGDVAYDVGRICPDGEMYCPEEGYKWKGVLEEEDGCMAAFMYTGELSDYGWCQMADALQKHYKIADSIRVSQYYQNIRKWILQAIATLTKDGKEYTICDLQRVNYLSKDYDFYSAKPLKLTADGIVFDDSIVADWKTVKRTYIAGFDYMCLDDLVVCLKYIK